MSPALARLAALGPPLPPAWLAEMRRRDELKALAAASPPFPMSGLPCAEEGKRLAAAAAALGQYERTVGPARRALEARQRVARLLPPGCRLVSPLGPKDFPREVEQYRAIVRQERARLDLLRAIPRAGAPHA